MQRLIRLSTHRLLQVAELADRASHERVSYYCRAIKATSINNGAAARFFTSKAQQWERIRVVADTRLIADAVARRNYSEQA